MIMSKIGLLTPLQLTQITAFYLFFMLSPATFAASIGELITADGEKYNISQFGSSSDQKQYFVKSENRFIPINEIQHITRIATKTGRFAYLLVLQNGNFATGRQGLLFYENVNFTNPSNGEVKNAYTSVIKDRGQSGLIFTTLIEPLKTEKVVEISYPNSIVQISLNENETEHKTPLFTQRITNRDN